ncbi:hypothetical protein ACOQFV_24655 [Nocardiopsis changdeensis]|uniref:Uncharacterized protein n=1 Tax=Nocardiopsis changdeensis TaxID=2831969 RepID=A0A975KUD3_9ACTN|nr:MULTISPECIES: hypothetical protein [Nocardiopsis]QUX26418.1 hypothetical protein KGD84_32485 [Nocardiopsis changdeensis]QYX40690.1 hypothetical protein K1J57_32335 [Nocardiopsis sp. MT53]
MIADPRVHPVPGTALTVEWDQAWEAYVVRGPGAPTDGGPLETLQALAQALDPVPLPERLRTALAADRAVRPPLVGDDWRRRLTHIREILAPLGTALTTVAPYIAAPRLEAVEVATDPAVPRAGTEARRILSEAGYQVDPHGDLASTYLVTQAGADPAHP